MVDDTSACKAAAAEAHKAGGESVFPEGKVFANLVDTGAGDDTIRFSGSNAYTTAQLCMSGGEGDDTVRAATAAGEYVGASRVDCGSGNDLIESGHVEGSRSSDSGMYSGDGNDTIRVLATRAGAGIFGNIAFTVSGGAGSATIDLQGPQYNLRGDAINTVDGGSGFDTLVWNASYDLNRGTNQTGVDATAPVYAAEIGARSIERLDVASSGATGRTISLTAQDVASITAGSDFDRAALDGLGLTGSGNTLFVDLGDASNQLTLVGGRSYRGNVVEDGTSYEIYEQGDSVLAVNGGSLAFNAAGRASVEALSLREIQDGARHVADAVAWDPQVQPDAAEHLSSFHWDGARLLEPLYRPHPAADL